MDLYLLDSEFNLISSPIDNYQSLIWHRKFYNNGRFTLYLSGKYFTQIKNATYISKGLDGDVGIIQRFSYTDRTAGILLVSGVLLEGALYDRVINETEQLRGELETKVKAVVTKYSMTDDRAIDNLIMGDTLGYTDRIDTQITGANLSEWLYEVLKPYNTSYSITYDFEENKAVFNLFRGLDRTQEQTVNSWAIFSKNYENLLKLEYEEDDSNYKNYAYVAGEATESGRTVEEVDLRAEGEPRYELFVDARDLQSEDGEETLSEVDYRKILRSRGLEKLSKYNKAQYLDAEIDDNSNLKYKQDYDLGDKCNIEISDIGLSWTAIISEVQEVYEGSKMKIVPIFGESVLDLKNYIKREANK